ncbi:aminotransferase class V-fold PLP-dependent enzyme [Geotalea uraniireducens]|uniref:cysteine desulfurase n=1 Tax=Geotalea uraniireducens (strain Rf4) TaxID=351605 RepID=A5G648_GEOUR|nr:aminotransferase class V-fold PLP-dependent enzyme [Geotalea uraniireducens]ABQ27266.1 cysteine desulfurase family protein [Geotalea uraniireducens Rf4]
MLYINNASTSSPKPEAVYKAVELCIRTSGMSSDRSSFVSKLDFIPNETRALIAKLINASDPTQIVFTMNGTEALNLAIKGILKRGDHVITTSLEHNSVIRPLKHLEQDGDIELSIVQASSEGLLDPNDIVPLIKSNTKLIVTAHITNVLGTTIPIEEIGKIAAQHNIKYLVDAAQSIGFADIDVEKMNIDMLAFPGHKSLFGPSGTGGLYIKKGIDLTPIKYGGTGNLSEPITQPDFLPYKYESGTPNTLGICGLNAGLKFVASEGVANIRKHEHELACMLYEELSTIKGVTLYGPKSPAEITSIVAFNVKDKNPMKVANTLITKFGIITRPGLHCAPLTHQTVGTWKDGSVRISAGYFNTKEHIDEVVKAVAAITAT